MLLSAVGTDTSTVASSSSSASETDPASMQDRFLKLLVAQLTNQDPLNPMDNSQMTTQMAQISTVTGLQNLNLTMQSMADQYSTMQQIQGTTLIGRTVLLQGDSMNYDSSGVGTGYFDLDSASTSTQVNIVTAGGQVVDTVQLGAEGQGRHSFQWDSSSYAGDPGTLHFEVAASTASGAVNATALTQQQVISTGSDSGALTLTLQDGSVVNYINTYGVL